MKIKGRTDHRAEKLRLFEFLHPADKRESVGEVEQVAMKRFATASSQLLRFCILQSSFLWRYCKIYPQTHFRLAQVGELTSKLCQLVHK